MSEVSTFEALKVLDAALQQAQELKQQSEVLALSNEILSTFEALPPLEHQPKAQRASVLLFKGRALSMLSNYSKQAEEALSRSVKLDPTNGETWVWLGEIFYHKQDYLQSKRCFEGSIEHSGENKVALRKLSMISRLIGENNEKQRAVQESVELAKKAVALDMRDGYSWYVLGNAHLTNYFMNRPSAEELTKALKAYSQAEGLLLVPEPDLHYNRAEAFKYLERYQDAYNDFTLAHAIDPTLNAQQQSRSIIERVTLIVGRINSKGGVKKKILGNLLNSLATSVAKQTFPQGYRPAVLRDLEHGMNPRKILACKVLGNVNSDPNDVPSIFLVCDAEGEFFSLSLYNTNPYIYQNMTFNSESFIRDPAFGVIELAAEDQNFSYRNVKVTDPNTIVVDKQKIVESFSPSTIVNQSLGPQ